MKQGGGDDEQLCAAWGKVGTYYTDRGKWGKAVQYFKHAKDLAMMAECYYRSVRSFEKKIVITSTKGYLPTACETGLGGIIF